MPEYKLQRLRGGWAIATYVDGKRTSRRRLPATGVAEAARQFEQLVAAYRKPDRLTIAAIWDAYRADKAGRPIATTMGFERKAVVGFFGEMSADHLTDEICRAYTAGRRGEGRHDGTIWTELGHLRTALKWAEETKRIDRAPRIERPPKPPAKDRYLTRDEAARLLAAATMPHVRLFIILAITTAGRSAALLDLKWERVDFDRGVVRLAPEATKLAHPKKGRATVPLNNTLTAALAEARTGARTPYVIEWAGGRVHKVRKGIQAAARRAGLAGVTPHVLRHTAAVWMAESGRAMSEIAQYLGHADSRITERVYARYSPDHLRGAAGALELGNLRSAPGSNEPVARRAGRRKAS